MVIICCLALEAVGSAQEPSDNDASLQIRAAMDAGVDALKNARFEDAVVSLQEATRLDPGNAEAHLYLGTAYQYQFVPNLLTPDNMKMATSALAELDVVLKIHPHDLTAMKQEAALYRYMQRPDEALSMDRRIIAVDPGDAEAFCSIGLVDWTLAYKNAVDMLAEDGLLDDGMGNAKMAYGSCMKLRDQNAALVTDGISNLTRAIELKPDYDDAMQYLQLMYRLHADLACGDAAARSRDLKIVDESIQKAMEIRKQAEAGKEAAKGKRQ